MRTMPTVPPSLVAAVVDGLKPPVLVLDGTVPEVPQPPPPYGAVVLVASDLVALRDALGDLPELGRARMIGVVVAEAGAPLSLRTRPTWPALQDLDARLEQGAAVTVAKFASRLDVADVLAGIAYADGRPGHDGLVVARDYDPDDKVPPDVVIGAGAVEESPVLGRPPAVVTTPARHRSTRRCSTRAASGGSGAGAWSTSTRRGPRRPAWSRRCVMRRACAFRPVRTSGWSPRWR